MKKQLLLASLLCLIASGPSLAQSVPPPATLAQAPAASELEQWETLLGEQLSLRLRVSVTYGNFQATARLTRTLDEVIGALAARQRPADSQKFADWRRISKYESALCKVYGGQPLAGFYLVQEMLPESADRPDSELFQRVLLASAARQAARPDLLDQQLPRLAELAGKSSKRAAPLLRFVSDSFALEREIQAGLKLDKPALVKRAHQSLRHLNTYKLQGGTAMEGRFYWSAARIWLKQGAALATFGDKDPADKELVEIAGIILSHGLRLLKESILAQEFNPEFVVGFCDFVIDYGEESRAKGDLVDSARALKEVDDVLAVCIPKIAQTEKLDALFLQEGFRKYARAVQQARQEGVQLEPGTLQFSGMPGDVSRIMARQDLGWMRHLECAGKLTPALREERLAAAETHQARAAEGQGYLGMEDARWIRLRILTSERPAGWENRAESLLSQLLPLNEKLSFSPGQIMGLTYQGELKAAQGRKPEAVQSLQRAVALAEEYISQVGGGAEAAARVRSEYKRAYDALTRLQLETGQGQEAFNTLSRLQQLNSVSRASSSLGQNVSRLRSTNDSLQNELSSRKAGNQDTKPIEELLAKNKAEFHLALNQIRAANPRYESLLAIRPVNFSKQQKYNPENAAIVQYFPAQDCLYIFVATTTDLKIHKVPVASADLEKLVLDFRRTALKTAQARLSWKDDSALRGGLFRLHAWLIDPVEADIASKEVLAFIPTGFLDYLPFAALARPNKERGAEFLIERKQCVTLLKSSDLDQLSRGATAGGGNVLAFANPDGSLPSAEKEVEAISGTFPGSHKYLRGDAGKDKLSLLGPGISYLHLATHGVRDSSDPSSSYLVMAGAAEQGKLRIPAIYGLKLEGVRLVTLSACQTALGEREPGSELSSLADAFSVAGTNSVVASLWSVADDSTRELMVSFYTNLKGGKSLAASLQQAELALLHNPATTHPFFWAPFTLIGDWR